MPKWVVVVDGDEYTRHLHEAFPGGVPGMHHYFLDAQGEVELVVCRPRECGCGLVVGRIYRAEDFLRDGLAPCEHLITV